MNCKRRERERERALGSVDWCAHSLLQSLSRPFLSRSKVWGIATCLLFPFVGYSHAKFVSLSLPLCFVRSFYTLSSLILGWEMARARDQAFGHLQIFELRMSLCECARVVKPTLKRDYNKRQRAGAIDRSISQPLLEKSHRLWSHQLLSNNSCFPHADQSKSNRRSCARDGYNGRSQKGKSYTKFSKKKSIWKLKRKRGKRFAK